MKVGIGSDAHIDALIKAGCDRVFSISEIRAYMRGGEGITPLTLDFIFRPDDTVVMVQPGYIDSKFMREIAATGVAWQVVGHDPMRFASNDDRAEWRRQKPKGVDHGTPEPMGRPPTYPVPSADQVAAFLSDWNSAMKRALVDGRMRKRLGFQPDDKKSLPSHWMRDLALKHQGTAKRNKD